MTNQQSTPDIVPVTFDNPLEAARFTEAIRAPRRGSMQESRFENKYLIQESQTPALRELVKAHLTWDEFTAGKEGRGYFVHSLYLDTRDFHTYWETEQESFDRYKLRIRFYDDDPRSPCFLEVKMREGERIIKTRAMADREPVQHFCLTGRPITESDLISPTEEDYRGLDNFLTLAMRYDMHPAAFTSYLREGYEREKDNRSRITFDRDLRAGKFTGVLSAADRDNWVRIPMGDGPGALVFEMKYTDIAPRWMKELAQIAKIEKTSYKKYIQSVEAVTPVLTRWGHAPLMKAPRRA